MVNDADARAFAEQVVAAIRARGQHTREVRSETLPPEVKAIIEQMIATLDNHETRLARLEATNAALITEAVAKIRGAAA